MFDNSLISKTLCILQFNHILKFDMLQYIHYKNFLDNL